MSCRQEASSSQQLSGGRPPLLCARTPWPQEAYTETRLILGRTVHLAAAVAGGRAPLLCVGRPWPAKDPCLGCCCCVPGQIPRCARALASPVLKMVHCAGADQLGACWRYLAQAVGAPGGVEAHAHLPARARGLGVGRVRFQAPVPRPSQHSPAMTGHRLAQLQAPALLLLLLLMLSACCGRRRVHQGCNQPQTSAADATEEAERALPGGLDGDIQGHIIGVDLRWQCSIS